MYLTQRIAIAGLLLAFTACGSDPGARGPLGQWIKGKKLSAKISAVSMGPLNGPLIELRNDSNEETGITPFRVEVTFPNAGKKSERFEGLGELTPALKPGESVTLPFMLMGGVAANDFPRKVSIYIGPEGGAEQEVFTATFK